jgi:hypothetical protein
MCSNGISFSTSCYRLVRGKNHENYSFDIFYYFRLIQRHDVDQSIRTEFILLLCPDERLNEQIRTFTNETFRYLTKETSLKDRQHLRAFKLSNFFHVIISFNIPSFYFLFFY